MNTPFPTRAEIKALQEQWAGQRVELISMDDQHAPVQPGTLGTVSHVDDAGTLHMSWDNGRTLGLIPGIDEFKAIAAPAPKSNKPR
jgi:hypothetical protein